MFSSRFGVGLLNHEAAHWRRPTRGSTLAANPRTSRARAGSATIWADVAAAILTGDLRRRTATRGDLPLDHPARRAGELGDALVLTERNELIEDR
jgi:hypothetical protein